VNVTESAQAAMTVCEKLPHRSAANLLQEYTTLIKARITAMVMFTAWCGAYLAANQATHSAISWPVAAAILGIGLVAAGTAAANQVMERHTDAKMRRTAQRPLVTGSIPVSHAISATLLMIVGGTLLTAFAANLQAAMLTLATSLVYIAIYTPLKKVTPLCTAIGAIPGAMPILLGWVAIRGRVDWQAALLFAVLFFWQFPHFHAISLLYAEDYRRGDIRMLPVVEPDGVSTRRRIIAYSFVLLGVTLLPTLAHMTGVAFGVVALALGSALIVQSFRIAMHGGSEIAGARIQAHRMLLATVIYLPVLMIAFLVDHAM
jgi:protoheme IX farnesyltransferase